MKRNGRMYMFDISRSVRWRELAEVAGRQAESSEPSSPVNHYLLFVSTMKHTCCMTCFSTTAYNNGALSLHGYAARSHPCNWIIFSATFAGFSQQTTLACTCLVHICLSTHTQYIATLISCHDAGKRHLNPEAADEVPRNG